MYPSEDIALNGTITEQEEEERVPVCGPDMIIKLSLYYAIRPSSRSSHRAVERKKADRRTCTLCHMDRVTAAGCWLERASRFVVRWRCNAYKSAFAQAVRGYS